MELITCRDILHACLNSSTSSVLTCLGAAVVSENKASCQSANRVKH